MQEQRSYLPGYVDCYVMPDGTVFKDGKQKVPIKKGSHALKIRVQENNRTREYGLATLVAKAFIANPDDYRKVIFKDGNQYNCKAENIAWVSNKEFSRHSLFPGKPMDVPRRREDAKEKKERKSAVPKTKAPVSLLPADAACQPIPGTIGYYATPTGDVYSGDKKLKPLLFPNKAACVKVKGTDGKRMKHTIARLVALAFLPNADNHKRVIFTDRDKSNCRVANLAWASEWEYRSFYRSKHCDLLGSVRHSKKKAVPVERHPDCKPVEGFPHFFIAPDGTVYKGNRTIQPRKRERRSLQVCLRMAGIERKKYRTFGLAKLVALHFVPNPRNYPYVIFKDRDNQNCHKDNIAWVDGETFAWYSGLLQSPGRKKKMVLTPEAAIAKCTHPLLLQYYQTGDEGWLSDIWNGIEKKLGNHPHWKQYRSDCYLYFIDRMKRFSITGDPVGLLLCYLKGLRVNRKKEISYDMPLQAVLQTDESLRNFRGRDVYDIS